MSVASELDFVLANAELLVRNYPFAFALSITNAITLHVENKTYWEGTLVLNTFRLEPRTRGVDQDPIRVRRWRRRTSTC